MTDSEIDVAILSSTDRDWKKVAMVICLTAQRLQGQLPDNDETHDRIAARIESLIAQGRLQGRGDLKRWRHSEIRCPD